jgi:hypothetical protein
MLNTPWFSSLCEWTQRDAGTSSTRLHVFSILRMQGSPAVDSFPFDLCQASSGCRKLSRLSASNRSLLLAQLWLAARGAADGHTTPSIIHAFMIFVGCSCSKIFVGCSCSNFMPTSAGGRAGWPTTPMHLPAFCFLVSATQAQAAQTPTVST